MPHLDAPSSRNGGGLKVGGTETPPLGNAPPAQTGTETAMIKEEAGVRLGGYTGYTTIGVMHTEPRTQIGSESTTWLLGAKPTTASSLVVEGELVLRVLTVCGSERQGGIEAPPAGLQEAHDHSQLEAARGLTTGRIQLTAWSTCDSSDKLAKTSPFPEAHLTERQQLFTRLITLINNDNDGIPDFVTEAPPRTRIAITRNPINTFYDESSPPPTATRVRFTFTLLPSPWRTGSTLPPTNGPTSSDSIPTTFITVTITSSPTIVTPNPTENSTSGPLAPAANKTSMGIGIGVAVGVVILAFSAVYCCCGKEKLLAKFGNKKKKDKGKGRAVSPGQAEEKRLRGGGVGGGGGGWGGGGGGVRDQLAPILSVQEYERLQMEGYRTPEGQQGLGIRSSGMDSPFLSQQRAMGGGFGTGSRYSPAMSARQFSKPDSYSEVYMATPAGGSQHSLSTPTSMSFLTHHDPTLSSPYRSSDLIHHYEQAQPHTKKVYTATNLPRQANTYARSSLESRRTSNDHSPHTRTRSFQTPVAHAAAPRQPRWASFSGVGDEDGTGLGRPPVAMEAESESVVMSSVCGREGVGASLQPTAIGLHHGMLEQEQEGCKGKQFSGGDRDAAGSRGSSKMLDSIRYYNGLPSTSTTGGDSESHYPSDIIELAPVYTLAGFVPVPAASTSTALQPSSRSNTPLGQPQPATFRPFPHSADSPVYFHVPSEPALILGAERRPSSVTLTIMPPTSSSRPNTTTTNAASTPGTNGIGVGPGQERISIDSANWPRSFHASHSRGGSVTPSADASVRTLRRQVSQFAMEQVTSGVPSPLESLIRAHLPRGGTYDESGDIESSLPEPPTHPRRLAVQEWIQSSPSAWGDPERSSVAGGGTDLEFAEAEEGQEGKGGWRMSETLVEGDSVSHVEAKRRF